MRASGCARSLCVLRLTAFRNEDMVRLSPLHARARSLRSLSSAAEPCSRYFTPSPVFLSRARFDRPTIFRGPRWRRGSLFKVGCTDNDRAFGGCEAPMQPLSRATVRSLVLGTAAVLCACAGNARAADECSATSRAQVETLWRQLEDAQLQLEHAHRFTVAVGDTSVKHAYLKKGLQGP